MPKMTSLLIPIAPLLVMLNGIMFMLQFSDPSGRLIEMLALWPIGSFTTGVYGEVVSRFHFWQLLTYAFLHGGFFHLFLNMYALWLFGTRMELLWGSKAFAIYYFVCVIGAGVTQLLVAYQGSGVENIYPTIGASGGVFGLLLAFGLSFPNEKLMLVFPPVVLKAKWFVLIYAAVELYFGVTGTLAGVAHFAHLGGMLFGYILIRYWHNHPPAYR